MRDRVGPLAIALTTMMVLFGEPGAAAGDVAAIREARERSNAAIKRHDVAGVLVELEEDAAVTASNGSQIQGWEAQRTAYGGRFDRFPDVAWIRTPETIRIGADRLFASERGTWIGRWTADGGPVEVHGEYQAMWRRSGGRWRIRSELFVALDCNGPACSSSKGDEGVPGAGRPRDP